MTTYRTGNKNARNIYRVDGDGTETHIGCMFTEEDGLTAVAALNSYEPPRRTFTCSGCGSKRVVVRADKAYCTEPTCDRRLPGPPCERCRRPRSLHICPACSTDEIAPGPGCINCRQTGWNQTPCLVTDEAPSGGAA